MKTKYEYRQEFFQGLSRGPETEKGMRRAIDAAVERGDFGVALSLYHDFFRECCFYDDTYECMLLLPANVALFEAHPECWEAGASDMMWTYKWCADDFQCFYQISREQIEAMLKNYSDFCDRFHYNKKTYYEAICKILRDIDPDGTVNGLSVAECRQRMSRLGRDALSDCRACELDTQIEYTLYYDNDLERALRMARPLFVGTMSCAEVPHCTYARFAHHYLKMGRFAEAEEYADKSWRLINRTYSTTTSLADFEGVILLTYAYTNRRKGIAVFKKTFPYCWNMKNAVFSWKYYYGVYHLMAQLEQAGSKQLTFRFPDKAAGLTDENNKCAVRDLKNYMRDRLQFLSDKLDERNGNRMYNNRLSIEYRSEEINE